MEDDLMDNMSDSDERNWALLAHLGMIAGKIMPFFGNLILPFIVWQMNKHKSEFVADHAKEALNFQLTMTIIYIGCGLMCIILIGFPMLLVALIIDIVLSIQAVIKASDGQYYDYPFNFRIIE